MKNNKLFKFVVAALFAAIICVATMVVQIPIPQGYANLGDCFVLLSGWFLGPVFGSLAAGLGSALADMLAFPAYASATFVIKALMALAAYFVFKAISKKPFIAKLISGLLAEAIMVLGYFGYEAVILKLGLSASASIIFNVMQGAVGLVAAIAVATLISKNKTLNSFFKR